MTGITERLAGFATGPVVAPEPVRRAVRLSLLDWLAVGRARVGEPVAQAARGLALEEGRAAQAGFFGGGRAPARAAALVNGATSHALDHDETHFLHIGHPSDIVVTEPLVLGRPAIRRSTINAVEFKSGSSGALCFVRVRHEIEQEGRSRLRDVHTIVYRDHGPPEPAPRQPGDPAPEGFAVHDDLQLLRYSFVTRNGHRIHWGRDFCRRVEGYPDLVVHGPLLASRLAEALRARRSAPPRRFAFRSVAPVFVSTPIRVEAEADGMAGRILRSDGREALIGGMGWG